MARGHWMLRGAGLASVLLLAACGGAPPPPEPAPAVPAPFYVSGGAGSERGNFASRPDTETVSSQGVHCVIYVWDRPLTADTALRLRSASCEDPRVPGMFIAHEIERMVIPRASSTLDQPD